MNTFRRFRGNTEVPNPRGIQPHTDAEEEKRLAVWDEEDDHKGHTKKQSEAQHNQAAQRAAFVVWLLYRPEYLLKRTEGNEVTSAAAVDMAGRTVATAESFANGMAKLEMQRCATGVYVAVVRLKSGKTVSRKFVHWQH